MSPREPTQTDRVIGCVIREPWASRETCANNHPWTRSSTRWRVRMDKGESAATRDCLVCKRHQEGNRRKRRRAEARSI